MKLINYLYKGYKRIRNNMFKRAGQGPRGRAQRALENAVTNPFISFT